jgi:FMN-dependent NADH-azoreductase
LCLLLHSSLSATERKEGVYALAQKGYIDFWLKFIGVKEVHTLVVEGTTWGGKEKGEEAIARGQKEATRLAADF